MTLPADLARAERRCSAAGRAAASDSWVGHAPSAPAGRLRSAGSRSRMRRGSPVTRTATSPCTRSPTRSWARPRWATSGRQFPADASTPASASRAAAASAVVERSRDGRPPTAIGRRDDRRGPAAARRPPRRDARRDRGAPRREPSAVSVKASTGNLAGVEGAGRASRPRRSPSWSLVADDAPPPRHADRRSSATSSSRSNAGRVGIYSCGPTVYGPAHIGNFRVVPVRRRACPVPAIPRLRGPLGDEHHRHRRQDHQGRRGRGQPIARAHGPLDGPVPGPMRRRCG